MMYPAILPTTPETSETGCSRYRKWMDGLLPLLCCEGSQFDLCYWHLIYLFFLTPRVSTVHEPCSRQRSWHTQGTLTSTLHFFFSPPNLYELVTMVDEHRGSASDCCREHCCPASMFVAQHSLTWQEARLTAWWPAYSWQEQTGAVSLCLFFTVFAVFYFP